MKFYAGQQIFIAILIDFPRLFRIPWNAPSKYAMNGTGTEQDWYIPEPTCVLYLEAIIQSLSCDVTMTTVSLLPNICTVCMDLWHRVNIDTLTDWLTDWNKDLQPDTSGLFDFGN